MENLELFGLGEKVAVVTGASGGFGAQIVSFLYRTLQPLARWLLMWAVLPSFGARRLQHARRSSSVHAP